jgi:hypothetical protein
MIKTCDSCACDKVCDHNKYNFENCDSYTSKWISVTERTPGQFASVLGCMTDAEPFPAVRECYRIGKGFYFPALGYVCPISHWMPMPEVPKGEE